ncbi:protein YqjF [Fulvivirga imtechensis AK7]|uniref:Protein YqjF n=1 Tax=Fulvivirga imtechensis AK7 TaxID=1237149 RepID=L8JNZ7_9BACT|nr:DUF2071 domain-containing protein [Fulvivirga imtechensis]ELR70681.1 protein YqjF [Fulvivirga imtechensis AK7]
MRPKQLLNAVDHRSQDLPTGRWKFYQEWNNVIFLHWQVARKKLREFVPEELEFDTHEGQCWVSLVAFTMNKVRFRNLPPFPPVSDFHEVNIRTYVKMNNSSGVYFLSMEGAKKLSCKIAKMTSVLPYRYSKMERDKYTYTSKNQVYDDHFNIRYDIGQIDEKDPLGIWLTERYALFQDSGPDIFKYQVHHQPWPLYTLHIHELEVSYKRFYTLLTGVPARAHYSPGVSVVSWDKEKV